MFGICTLLFLIGMFVDSRENGGKGLQEILASWDLGKLGPKGVLRRHFMCCDYFLLAFLLITLLSSACSEWPYEAFWGTMGRYQGAFLWIWYVVAYFMVTRFFRFRKWYFDVFLAVGLYVAVWQIQDYMNLDPHGWLADVVATQKHMFTSSIGNVNTYTAVIALYMSVSAVLFVSEKNRGLGRCQGMISVIRLLFYGAGLLIFFTAMITGQSDNAVLGVAALFAFLPFYAWKDRRGFVRYFWGLVLFAGAMLLTQRLTLAYPNPYIGFWSGLLLGFCEKSGVKDLLLGLAQLAAVIWLLCTFLPVRIRKEAQKAQDIFREKKRSQGQGQEQYNLTAEDADSHTDHTSVSHTVGTSTKRASVRLSRAQYELRMEQKLPAAFRLIWLALGIAALLGLIWIFWDANHGGHPEWYAPYSNLFYFDNNWGTHRGHNWGILMRHFQEFPLWKKLIGSGPETYGIVTYIFDYNEMIDLYGETYDSPHNEFLQYLFSVGITGFVAYYGFLITGAVQAWKGFGRHTESEQLSSLRSSVGSIQGSSTAGAAEIENLTSLQRNNGAKKNGAEANHSCAAAGVFAVISYTMISFVNICVPIVVPLMLMSLFAGIAISRGNVQGRES